MTDDQSEGQRASSPRIHQHWIVIIFIAAAVALFIFVMSSFDKLDETRSAQKSEIDDLSSRISDAEERIEVLEKSNSFAKAALAKEADDRRDQEQRAQELERLRANERLIDSNQQMLCDATGDC